MFRVIDDMRWKYHHKFNNMVISETLAKELFDACYAISRYIEPIMRMPNEGGSIYVIPFITNKHMPKDIVILRNDSDIVAVINIGGE